MAEAEFESEIVESPEAEVLQEAIFKAVQVYSDFLERHGLIWEYGLDPDYPDLARLKAQALVVTLDYGDCSSFEIKLKDGAFDRVYGDGVNPDPWGFDADPSLSSKS
jgi:hypothetical protein